MQSAGGGAGGGGPSRVGPAGRAASTSSAGASPSSSSSAVSTPQLGFDSVHQQQQLGSRQVLQPQLLRKPDGNESLVAYQGGPIQGVIRGSNLNSSPGSMQMPQQSRNFSDLSQQHGSPQDSHRNHPVEQQTLNPVHQAYLQYAFQQQKSALAAQSQQQVKIGPLGPASSKDQNIRMGNFKMLEPMSLQAANQAQPSSSRTSSENFSGGERQAEKGQHLASELWNEPKPPTQGSATGQSMPADFSRPMQAPQAQQSMQNMANNQLAMAAQLQAMQAWAMERNIDLSLPANANLVQQLIPLMQSRMATQQESNESNAARHALPVPISVPKHQVSSPPVASESSLHANSSTDVSGPPQTRQTLPGPFGLSSSAGIVNSSNNLHSITFNSRENQVTPRTGAVVGNGMSPMHPPQTSTNMRQAAGQNLPENGASSSQENLQMQQLKQSNQSSPQSNGASDGSSANPFPSPGSVLMGQKKSAFTKQQLHVLKAQILALRRLKKGGGTLPQELLRAISPPPLESQLQQQLLPAGGNNQDRSGEKLSENLARHLECNQKNSQSLPPLNGHKSPKEEASADERTSVSGNHMRGTMALVKEPTTPVASRKEEQQAVVIPVKPDHEADQSLQKAAVKSDLTEDRGKSVAPQLPSSEAVQPKKPAQASTAFPVKDTGSSRKYHGPLFDFPFFTRKHDSVGSSGMINANNNLTLAYDVRDLFSEEGKEVLNKKRSEKLQKINGLLTVNLERQRIMPDIVLRLRIEEKKLRLLNLQARLRNEVDQQQQEIMAMPDRSYQKFVQLCERQRMEQVRQVQVSQKAMREKQLKSIFQWRKKLLEAHWVLRDARTARNRGVAKYHDKMLREFSKRKDDDRNRRMEALKNNDVERYRQMLLEQQISMPGDAAERYSVLSSFLTQTEEYLHKLGSKITAAKNHQEIEEAANAAAAAARHQGLSEEEVRAAAACAGEEVMIRNQFMEMNAPRDNSSVNKYYNLAHAVNERVIRQPSMLRAGTLRDYQLVGLQWMLSLYNNKLNGILADEMGLGKTVQVMALIAYLMEFKGNYGPHLIIVPNAVLVNWKSELHNWLPSVSCIYYVGTKDQRSKLFSQVCSMKYNVLVTTYEFIMYDRSKLSKVDWKYIIIDEAQRMKDRESVLARDLDRYRCQRRLLLTGTPLQNDLKELWSLLNLLLPEVFDNRKAFHDWFSKPFQKENSTHESEDDWLETEKKVIIIHRLHQILEPFMLRRQVQDVEGSLPPKVSIVLRCRMSAFQSAIYDWIKSTGTIRVDPEDEKLKVQRNPSYQPKVYKTLYNRCMELRKTCNHPLLNYPYFNEFSKDFLVRSCGKLWILDRVLVKLQRTGHKVLLFSTMTKLLDILEEYLQWRRFVFRRIDGTTSLEDRESAIVDFNSPDSDCFIFLLSIRAAGRGLNLQSADTVIIYDPDPNPKNEEQAVARAHRIGQKREVKVLYMEAVVDKISSHQREDELRSGGSVDLEDDLAGKDRYIGSIESLIRNNIQQYKIEMADEVINAGRFDQRTTHEERRMTLEAMLHDEERYQETLHDVPSLKEVNRMIARSEEEVQLFDQMDEELEWTEEMTSFDQVPKWLRASTRDVDTAVAKLSKKPPKNLLYTSGVESGEIETERKRGRPKGKKRPNYKEIDDGIGEYSETGSDERNGHSAQEEGDFSEFEEDESSDAVGAPTIYKDQSEDEDPAGDVAYKNPRATEGSRGNHILEEGGSSGSSSGNRRMAKVPSSVSSKKFASLSALEGRPESVPTKLADDIEEGELGGSGDSRMDRQLSGSWVHDCDEYEDEQVLQPKIKRKRSIRLRPHNASNPHVSPKSSRLNMHSRESWDGRIGNSSGSQMLGSKMSDFIQRKCKNVISKLRKRIDNEGQQIVPLLKDLWKRIENSGYKGGAGNNLLNLQMIETRVDRLEYNGVEELVFDVQFMLKGAMQLFGFSHEVRVEAKKVHDLFFDILGNAFPDIDLRQARNALTFASQVSTTTSTPSPRQAPTAQNKRHGSVNEAKQYQHDKSPPHPGELVTCKKKRKDRDRSAVRARAGLGSPISPPSMMSPFGGSVSKDRRSISHQQGQPSNGSGEIVGWANPVKRLRTDSGKRRPSHL